PTPAPVVRADRHHSPSRLSPSRPLDYYRPAPADVYTLSLHDALPISYTYAGLLVNEENSPVPGVRAALINKDGAYLLLPARWFSDRKSTRLNSSHDQTSYAVFCLKKKNSSRVRQLLTDASSMGSLLLR